MAAYNGAKYIGRQLTSIVNQLGPHDELVVVDDASTDGTVQIVNSYKDPRIHLYINANNIGVARTFNRALHLSHGDLIFLSDQDDRWYNDKIAVIRENFSARCVDLIVHDAVIIKENRILYNSLFKFANSSAGIVKNFISNTYTGCCMAFKRKILDKILPVPANKGIFHDAWIGILAEYYGYKVAFIDIPLIEFNRHDRNASILKRRKIIRVLSDRLVLLSALTKHIMRAYFKKQSCR